MFVDAYIYKHICWQMFVYIYTVYIDRYIDLCVLICMAYLCQTEAHIGRSTGQAASSTSRPHFSGYPAVREVLVAYRPVLVKMFHAHGLKMVRKKLMTPTEIRQFLRNPSTFPEDFTFHTTHIVPPPTPPACHLSHILLFLLFP
jgi:hypothetical protein